MGLKPSEKRALQEQKRLEAERAALEKAEAEAASREAEKSAYGSDDSERMSAEEREKILEARAKRQRKYDGREAPIDERRERNADKSYKKLPEEEIDVKGDGYHREGFFGSHIRLITFIITITLVLTVLGPWGIDILVSKSREGWTKTEGVTDLKDITIEDVLRLEESGNITWESLSSYNYTDSSYEKKGKTTYNHKYYFAESENLCLEVIGYSNKGRPDIVRLIDYNSPDGMESFVDLYKESGEKFLEEHGYLK